MLVLDRSSPIIVKMHGVYLLIPLNVRFFFRIRLITYIIKCCKPGGGGSVVEGGGGAALGGSKVQLSSSWWNSKSSTPAQPEGSLPRTTVTNIWKRKKRIVLMVGWNTKKKLQFEGWICRVFKNFFFKVYLIQTNTFGKSILRYLIRLFYVF